MALSLDDPETDRLARQIASLTGEWPWDDAAIDAIIERFNALPLLDDRTDDEILGYGENGLPS